MQLRCQSDEMKFERRFRQMEALASQKQLVVNEADLETLDGLWDAVKTAEKQER